MAIVIKHGPEHAAGIGALVGGLAQGKALKGQSEQEEAQQVARTQVMQEEARLLELTRQQAEAEAAARENLKVKLAEFQQTLGEGKVPSSEVWSLSGTGSPEDPRIPLPEGSYQQNPSPEQYEIYLLHLEAGDEKGAERWRESVIAEMELGNDAAEEAAFYADLNEIPIQLGKFTGGEADLVQAMQEDAKRLQREVETGVKPKHEAWLELHEAYDEREAVFRDRVTKDGLSQRTITEVADEDDQDAILGMIRKGDYRGARLELAAQGEGVGAYLQGLKEDRERERAFYERRIQELEGRLADQGTATPETPSEAPQEDLAPETPQGARSNGTPAQEPTGGFGALLPAEKPARLALAIQLRRRLRKHAGDEDAQEAAMLDYLEEKGFPRETGLIEVLLSELTEREMTGPDEASGGGSAPVLGNRGREQ